jgi:hypothetical protein
MENSKELEFTSKYFKMCWPVSHSGELELDGSVFWRLRNQQEARAVALGQDAERSTSWIAAICCSLLPSWAQRAALHEIGSAAREQTRPKVQGSARDLSSSCRPPLRCGPKCVHARAFVGLCRKSAENLDYNRPISQLQSLPCPAGPFRPVQVPHHLPGTGLPHNFSLLVVRGLF